MEPPFPTLPDHGPGQPGGDIAPDLDALLAVLKEAPFCVTLADLTLPDSPLVYVNDAFERMTGYPPSFALGRNCRFLQGTGTTRDSVDAIRAIIAAGRPGRVQIVNYRRDGTPFINRLSLQPIRDAAGRLVAFAGYQYALTDGWGLAEPGP